MVDFSRGRILQPFLSHERCSPEDSDNGNEAQGAAVCGRHVVLLEWRKRIEM
jgi:hypothetical protein